MSDNSVCVEIWGLLSDQSAKLLLTMGQWGLPATGTTRWPLASDRLINPHQQSSSKLYKNTIRVLSVIMNGAGPDLNNFSPLWTTTLTTVWFQAPIYSTGLQPQIPGWLPVHFNENGSPRACLCLWQIPVFFLWANYLLLCSHDVRGDVSFNHLKVEGLNLWLYKSDAALHFNFLIFLQSSTGAISEWKCTFYEK